MAPLTEAEMDALDDRFHACVDRIAAGDLAILAVARGEAIDPSVLTLAADAMAELLAEPRIEGTTWTLADVERVRGLRDAVGSGAPSDEARALAAACPPMLGEEPAPAA
jgi:hypothetical protein